MRPIREPIRRPRRPGAAVLTLAVALALTGCRDDDDDDSDDATAPSSAPVTPTAGTPGSVVAATESAPIGSATATAPTTPVVVATEPVVPTLDDTIELGGSQLYSIDLATGAASPRGRIGGAEVGVLGLAFAAGAGPSTVYGLTDVPELITFDIADPSTLTARMPITGVADGSTLLAIDVAPDDGRLLALSDAAVLYAIDPATGAATAIGQGLGRPVPDPGFGFDVDPVTGLVRIMVATGEHLVVVPATGAVDADGETDIGAPLAFAPGDANAAVSPRVVAAAFTANGDLYVIDAATGNLARQDPPDDGILTTIGPLGAEITDGASFDISPAGQALLASPG